METDKDREARVAKFIADTQIDAENMRKNLYVSEARDDIKGLLLIGLFASLVVAALVGIVIAVWYSPFYSTMIMIGMIWIPILSIKFGAYILVWCRMKREEEQG